MKKILLIFLFFNVSVYAYPQNQKNLSSLQQLYKASKHDTTKILTLIAIISEYGSTKIDTCAKIASQALEMSEKIGFDKGQAWALNKLAIIQYIQGAYAVSLKNSQKSLSIFEKMMEKTGTASTLNNLGNIYQAQSNYPLALENFQKSLKIQEIIGDKKGIGSALNNIGTIYQKQGNYPIALEYLQKSLKIREALGDKQDISTSLANIGAVYNEQSNYFLALGFHKKSLQIKEEIGDKQGIANALNNIGNIYFHQGNYPIALEYYQKSLKIREDIGDKQGIATSLNNIGNMYDNQRNYPMALESHQKSLQIKEEIGDKRGSVYSLNNIGNIHYNQQDYNAAIVYYDKSLTLAKQLKINTVAVSTNNIGLCYIGQKKYKEGFEYLLEARKMMKEQNLRKPYGENARWLANSYLQAKDYENAKIYAEESITIATEFKNLQNIKESSNILYEVYKYKKDYVKALEYHELYKQSTDSLFNIDKAKKIANLEARAEIERKEKEIEILNKNQEIAKKNEEVLKKDAKLQRIETERQKNANIILQKEKEAERLRNEALREKDKHKQDSLRTHADKIQLEADNLKIKQSQLNAEKKARELELLKEKESKEFQTKLNYVVIFGLICMAILAYFIFRSRQAISKQKEEVSQQKEEIQQINEELNTTLQVVESEKNKSDKLLLNILPLEVANELKETGKTDVRYFESVTVLFADVKGFSALATKISPQELIAELDATFTKMDEISLQFGLERIKTIGDCYMACGGLPEINQTHPFDVVLTALNIQHWMNEERKRRNGNFWQVRLGMHTGEAVAGVIGKTKFAYDIWGNTVNLASRMESGGEVGKVNVTEQTFNLVKDFFEGDYREEIEAKNIGKVKAYFITRLKTQYAKDELGFVPNERFYEMIKKG